MIVLRNLCAAVLVAWSFSSYASAEADLQSPAGDSPAAPVTLRYEAAIEAAEASGKVPAAPVFVTSGEFVSAQDEPFVAVMLYVPAGSPLAGADRKLTFFGLIEDDEGGNVAAFETPATLKRSRDDHYVETSLTGIPPGRYRGSFGLAEEMEIVALAETRLHLHGEGDPGASSISRLILSNNVFPLDRAQGPTDPFSFGGVKVVPKGDRAFRTTDELWYFFELRNPGVVEPPPPPEGVVIITPEPPAPRIQVAIDLDGTQESGKKVRMSGPPRDEEPIEMKGMPGHYGVGSAIPLETLKPGEYTLTVKVTDKVTKTPYTLTEIFRIVE